MRAERERQPDRAGCRYVKLLPPRDERNPVDRLDSYLRATLA
jgi:hypothetical protein